MLAAAAAAHRRESAARPSQGRRWQYRREISQMRKVLLPRPWSCPAVLCGVQGGSNDVRIRAAAAYMSADCVANVIGVRSGIALKQCRTAFDHTRRADSRIASAS